VHRLAALRIYDRNRALQSKALKAVDAAGMGSFGGVKPRCASPLQAPSTKRSKEKSQESLGIPGKMNREASRLGDVRIRRPSSREIAPETGTATTSRRSEI
jgi:hypothetical protein